MAKLILILCITSLLWCHQRQSPPSKPANIQPWEWVGAPEIETFVSKRLQKVDQNLQKKGVILWKAFLYGDTHQLPWNFLRAIQELNLPHLFTPSGLHFWSVRFALAPLEYLLCMIHPWCSGFLQILLFSFPFFLQKMLALKRMALLHFTLFFCRFWGNKKGKKKLNYFYIFLFIFFLDFIFGTYTQAPLSFILSFLFLGSLLSTANNPKSSLQSFLYISAAQIFFALLIDRPFSSMALLVTPILIGQFSVLFPLILLALTFPHPWLIEKTLWGTDLFMREIVCFYNVGVKYYFIFPWIEPSLFLVLGLPLIFCKKYSFKKMGIILILLTPSWAVNHSRQDWAKITKENLFPNKDSSHFSQLVAKKFVHVPEKCLAIPLEGKYFLKCQRSRLFHSR